MDSKEFTKESVSRDLPGLDYDPVVLRLETNPGILRLIHAGIGMSGEAGEVLDTLKKSMMYGQPIDAVNLKEECGDILWYMAIMLDQIDSSFEEVMEQNVIKLRKRYPAGFTEKDAIARADKTAVELTEKAYESIKRTQEVNKKIYELGLGLKDDSQVVS